MEEMDAIYERVGGLDVHKKSVVACRRRLTSSGRRVEKRWPRLGPQRLSCWHFWRGFKSGR